MSPVHSRPCAGLIAVVLASGLCLTGLLAADPTEPSTDPRRVFAVGDVQGSFDSLVKILSRTGLIDEELSWSGGRDVLVLTGDVLDKGVGVREVLDLLIRLEQEAASAGGRVFVLFGNHEAMNVLGELRDVRWEVYESFADDGSQARRERAYSEHMALQVRLAEAVGQAPPDDSDETRQTWFDTHPNGLLEYVEALSADGRYGAWLRTLPVAVQVSDTLFIHAGLTPSLKGLGLGEINRLIADEITNLDRLRALMVEAGMALPWYGARELAEIVVAEVNFISQQQGAGARVDRERVARARALQGLGNWGSWHLVRQDGPLWCRDAASGNETGYGSEIARMMEDLDVARVVIGHGSGAGDRIEPRFGGKVLLVTTGMSDEPWEGGRPAALELDGPTAVAVYLEDRQELQAR